MGPFLLHFTITRMNNDILYVLSVCYIGFLLAGFTLNDLKYMCTQHFQNFRRVPHCSFKRGLEGSF